MLEFWIMGHNFFPYHTDLMTFVSYMWEKGLTKIVGKGKINFSTNQTAYLTCSIFGAYIGQ